MDLNTLFLKAFERKLAASIMVNDGIQLNKIQTKNREIFRRFIKNI
ncbi:hypothetical protein LIS82_08880 [Cytobacillus solani]|nr:hypothetical protein [Cytobacillus solani]USK56566.1 hypothetical protein LIS82_08880 [Cytobacillus solani]